MKALPFGDEYHKMVLARPPSWEQMHTMSHEEQEKNSRCLRLQKHHIDKLTSPHIYIVPDLLVILVIAVVVQFTEMVVRKSSPLLHRVLGVYLPLITTNCAVLGVALLNINKEHNFMQSLFYGFGAAVGFSLVLVLFAAMRERLAVADVPSPFQGAAIGMITAGLMSLAFMGFAGLV